MKFEASWESLSQFVIPDWYQDAKFGIFIHWGIYSVPAFDNEWYSRNMYLQGSPAYEHHLERWGRHKDFGYKDFIPQFRAEHFDAEVWARLFREAGARYVMPVAEHHDGFAMYDSALSEWTAAKKGPKRDVLGELAQAVRKEGMVFGLSNHRAEHWWFMNGGKAFDSDVQDPRFADFYGPAAPGPINWEDEAWHSRDWQPRPDEAFLEDWLARNIELVDKYQPQLIYFDWWIRQHVFEPYLKQFAAYYYNRVPNAAINCKNDAFPQEAIVFGVERGQLKGINPRLWQADTSVSKNSWCYIEDHEYKTSTSLLHDLIDVVSKNGTLLLNIGPKPDGTIPDIEVGMLRDIGAWLGANGEAIYGTRPYKVFGEGVTEIVEGQFQDTKRADYTAQDIRFTVKGEAIYAIALGVSESLLIQSLKDEKISRVELLATGQELSFEQSSTGLKVELPALAPSPAVILKIIG